MSKKDNGKIDSAKCLSFTQRCPYCGGRVVLRNSNYVYHNSQNYGKMWVCENFPKCDAYVGCHPNTTIPLGRLADSELRYMKNLTHQAFDALWKSHMMTRKQAYVWLAMMLNIPQADCHIGMFDIPTCKRAIRVCNQQRNKVLNRYRENHQTPRYTRGYK